MSASASAGFGITANNSNAQWCGNSEKSNETDKMTYFTEAWWCVVMFILLWRMMYFSLGLALRIPLLHPISHLICSFPFQISTHVTFVNDSNLLRDYGVSPNALNVRACELLMWLQCVQFSVVKRCLINYTAVFQFHFPETKMRH